MRLELNPFLSQKHNHVLVKFAVSFLLIGFAFRLYFSDSITTYSSVVESTPPLAADTKTESHVVSSSPWQVSAPVNSAQDDEGQMHSSDHVDTEKCDIFYGEWVEDPSGPVYTNETCHVVEDHQNCMRNGRSDSGYLYWRWKPRDCELPKFNPRKFLNIMQGKSWAFIGDSISRNHVQSLVCTLSQVEPAVEVYHDKQFRSKRWHFPSYNFTVSVIWTPFLIDGAIFEDDNGVSSSEIQLHLDQLDKVWTDEFKNFDLAVIAGGKWFLKTAIYYENDTVQGCHYCTGKNLTELGFDYAYRKALQKIFHFITSSDHKVTVLFRTITPDHFENGEWWSGGYCNRTLPFKDGDVDMKDVDSIMRSIELEEFDKAMSVASERGVTLKLLDTSHLSLLRPDGHPGPYRHYHPFAEDKNAKVQNDCLHWCLPGPIDSWNDLIMALLVSGR